MSSSPAKRRKTDHDDGGHLNNTISAAVTQRSAFVLETAELLRSEHHTLEAVDELLKRLKTSIEAIESHEAIPVCQVSNTMLCFFL